MESLNLLHVERGTALVVTPVLSSLGQGCERGAGWAEFAHAVGWSDGDLQTVAHAATPAERTPGARTIASTPDPVSG
ncbi:Uncharacterised protein [Arthrobacter agilis]|uniref:hypothetical protein n=1 Tax=Arthrobacter agilis TaxID=37921 RepID=UPI000F718D04|nr:hypothetical protein [Arthrobacter agilis]VDR33256.1 Uncharacterised protein [Arthrobacter agilis]